jgi:hypothetical protein
VTVPVAPLSIAETVKLNRAKRELAVITSKKGKALGR